MSKQLTLQEIEGDGSAVKFDEGASTARAQIVNGMRNQFLSGSGFSQNPHSGVGRCYLSHFQQCRLQSRAVADDLFKLALEAILFILRNSVVFQNSPHIP